MSGSEPRLTESARVDEEELHRIVTEDPAFARMCVELVLKQTRARRAVQEAHEAERRLLWEAVTDTSLVEEYWSMIEHNASTFTRQLNQLKKLESHNPPPVNAGRSTSGAAEVDWGGGRPLRRSPMRLSLSEPA